MLTNCLYLTFIKTLLDMARPIIQGEQSLLQPEIREQVAELAEQENLKEIVDLAGTIEIGQCVVFGVAGNNYVKRVFERAVSKYPNKRFASKGFSEVVDGVKIKK